MIYFEKKTDTVVYFLFLPFLYILDAKLSKIGSLRIDLSIIGVWTLTTKTAVNERTHVWLISRAGDEVKFGVNFL